MSPTRWLKLLVVVSVALGASIVAQNPTEKILIRAQKPYSAAIASVNAVGGTVRHQFKYVDAIAADVPTSALPALRAMLGTTAVTKDAVLDNPRPVDVTARKGGPPMVATVGDTVADEARALDDASLAGIAGTNPAAYLINNGIANVSELHADGYNGLGVIVAVIDSGIRPGLPHITLDGSVIGCEDFVLDALGCSNAGNDGHGTFVAGMVSANVVFTFSPLSSLRNAVLAECPGCFINPPTNTQIPMIGTAPRSSIYALRVFGPTGGAPTSRVIAAIDRVIELRELYSAGNPAGRNIEVCNMSLGGSTLSAGRDLMDQAADALLAHDIVPVIAAANAGPSSLTVGSPGSSANALTVGAASLPHNERILRRLQFGPVDGALYRPFLGVQTAFFSSRGPNADGRPDPDVVSNGFANFGQGFSGPTTINIGSGTSYATPSVAGIAAVLSQRFPTASARLIRNAIIASANPSVLNDDSTVLDRGRGYVNAGAAAAMLAAGTVPAELPGLGPFVPSVKVNIESNTDLDVRDGNVSESLSGLKPGERFDLLYRVLPNTRQVVVALTNVTPVLPPAEQNQLFGDDILLTIHTPKTSAIGEGDYKVFTFSLTGGTFVINDPEDGIMRITVNGDWTNAGDIGASVHVFSVTDPVPGLTTAGKIANGQVVVMPLSVPAGTATADFRLSWREHWGQYPTHDIDLILVRPDGTLVVSGATLNSPEQIAIANPPAGNWLMAVIGFELAGLEDNYALRVALDGKLVKK
jgi:subtilisin family serine protease